MSSYRMKYKIGLVEHSVVVPEDMSAVPIGTILPYGANSLNPPYGFLWCDGSAISRSMYPDLFELIGTLYGSGDGSTTFNLPNLLGGRFLEGTDSAGTSKNPGLPNITGTFATQPYKSSVGPLAYLSGAFRSTANGLVYNSTSSQTVTADYRAEFNASLSNSIYGNSDTVQPKSLTIRYIIRAYTGASQQANIDLSVYASDLATRLQREQIPAFNKLVKLTSSQTWSAPVTGWYKFTIKGAGGGGQSGSWSTSLPRGGHGGGEGGTKFAYEHMEKNDTATIVVGAGGAGGTVPATTGQSTAGGAGGNSTVTVNGVTYTATGGSGYNPGGGDLVGACGGMFQTIPNAATVAYGGKGGGMGGGVTAYNATANTGGGGGGGRGYTTQSGSYSGGNGGSGFVYVEYFDPSL